MYEKYATPNKKGWYDEWKINCYGDFPNLPMKTNVESVFVLNARKTKIVPLGVLCALIAMIFVALGIIARNRTSGEKNY